MSTELLLHGRPVRSVFELLGVRENDITYSLGWALAQSPMLRQALLRRVFGRDGLDAQAVRLQQRVKDGGITDIEMIGPDVHVVVEAKRGWEAPGEDQLRLYLPRLERERRAHAAFVTMSECAGNVVAHLLPERVGEYPVVHLAWHEVQALARGRGKGHAENGLLRQLIQYLERVVKMQDKETNSVMTVVLSNDKPTGYGLTFKEIVLQKRMYFHPVSARYSAVPANYVGFRYDGFLQAIHHVESWEVVRDIHPHIPELNPGPWPEPHYLYRLGPAIVPSTPVRNGNIHPAAVVRAMLDLLLTSPTVAEAWARSKARLADED